jgi:hypothetical protein
VDTGFVIWLRAEKRGLPVADMLEQAIDRYEALLVEVARVAPPIVISAPLPTIGDGEAKGDVARVRRPISVSQRDRTELTLEFNRRMRRICFDRAWFYIDLDERSVGPDGLVSRHLLNRDPENHHYDEGVYAAMLAVELDAPLGRAWN